MGLRINDLMRGVLGTHLICVESNYPCDLHAGHTYIFLRAESDSRDGMRFRIDDTSGRMHWSLSIEDFCRAFGFEMPEKRYINGSRNSGRYPWEPSTTITLKPKKVIFNGPATIVIWKDGTKTIVKRREGEEDDREKAVMYAILKKMCGSKADMDRYLKLFLKDEEET